MFNLLGLCLGHFHNTIGRRYLTAIKENRTLLRCGFESVCETYIPGIRLEPGILKTAHSSPLKDRVIRFADQFEVVFKSLNQRC